MSDNNNPLTHMTDSVTPQPTAKDHLTNAQFSLTEVHNATVKLMRDIEEAKAAIPSDTPAPSTGISEADLKKLISLTWKEAISFANMHVEDEVCKEITVYAHIDERVYDSLDISIRGEVETEVNLGDHLDIEIPERYDGVAQTHDEILQLFHVQRQKEQEPTPPAPEPDTVSHVADPHNQLTGVKVVGSIDLSKNNA
mgnify:CR=1 FL=1